MYATKPIYEIDNWVQSEDIIIWTVCILLYTPFSTNLRNWWIL